MSPARAIAKGCFVIGPGLHSSIAGTTTEFSITSVDALGNARDVGGDVFSVVAIYSVAPPTKIRLWENGSRVPSSNIPVVGNVFDAGNGTYFGSVRPTIAGHHDVAVRTHGLHIKGSPFFLLVEPSSAIASWSSADWGHGLIAADVNIATTLTVTARDKYGNPVPGADAHISCELLSNTNGSCVSSFGNGSILCTYTPVVSGKGSLVVKYKGMYIRGSPFQIHVRDGDVDYNTTRASGTGLSLAVAGEAAIFTVEANDAGDNQRDDVDVSRSSNFSAFIMHKEVRSQKLSATVSIMGGGIYNFTYNATLAGEYEIFIIDEVVKYPEINGIGVPVVSPVVGFW